ncbi:MAG: 3-phosphoshikimate 1-carboxyvinyltransferase [Candidatus Zixiibacteriota bacterium]
MSEIIIKKAKKLQGAPKMPGDKSISHRAAILSLLCAERVTIENYSPAADCKSTLNAVKQLGAGVKEENGKVVISPPLGGGIIEPESPIDCGNSGTTMRLLAGLLAGADINATLTGDESLSKRPMKRIIEPLKLMNAEIAGSEEGTAPLSIQPATLVPIDYTMPVASAQVKSAILLAGASARTKVTVREKIIARDHTERMLQSLGADLQVDTVKPEVVDDPDDPRKKIRKLPTEKYKAAITLDVGGKLSGGEIIVPGDFSTAAFFIGAALMIRGSHLILKDVGVNNTRTGFLTVLKQMGAEIELKNRRDIGNEPVADIEVVHSKLKPRKISGDIIPKLIDEIPILALIAASLDGTTVIRDAEELRVKECDRIHAIAENLMRMGVKVGEFPDGLAIEGHGELEGAEIDTFGDHRIAMAFGAAGLAAHGGVKISDAEVVDISCPGYFSLLEGLRA